MLHRPPPRAAASHIHPHKPTPPSGTTSLIHPHNPHLRPPDQQSLTESAFAARYEKEFDGVTDVFELQRNLNNAFAYDLVPSTSVIVAALKAARRVNDFPTAVRIFEGTD